MRILIVAATAPEVPVVNRLSSARTHDSRLTSYTFGGHNVHVLVTGIGMVATAAWCSRTLGAHPYDIALNVGICGSFDRTIDLGSVVHVVSDRLIELGAEDDVRFIPVEELVPGADASSQVVNISAPSNRALDALPKVAGITVNTVHGSDTSIDAVLRRCTAQVESMEGAAFMYACGISGVPFAQVRAVSNYVEKRNRQAWKIPEAIGSLGAATLKILEAL